MHRKTERLVSSLLFQKPDGVSGGDAPLPTYRRILTEEFIRRCEKNPRYSLRAFATSLNIGVPHLSRILRGQRRISAMTARDFSEKLGLEPSVAGDFLASVERPQVLKNGTLHTDKGMDLFGVQRK